MTARTLTVADWERAVPDLRRRGRELAGPCPMPDCGGHDRFHVSEGDGGRALVGCRGCLDMLPEADRRRRFGEIVRAVFGNDDAGAREGAERKREHSRRDRRARGKPDSKPTVPIPATAPEPDWPKLAPGRDDAQGDPAAVWDYRMADSGLAFKVVRWNPPGGGKVIRPATWCWWPDGREG